MSGTFGRNIMILSSLGIGAAVVWWGSFYSEVNRILTGRPGPLPLECLYARTGPCRAVTEIVGWFGYSGYDPILLWISSAIFLIGLLAAVGSDDAGPVKRSNIERREPRL